MAYSAVLMGALMAQYGYLARTLAQLVMVTPTEPASIAARDQLKSYGVTVSVSSHLTDRDFDRWTFLDYDKGGNEDEEEDQKTKFRSGDESKHLFELAMPNNVG